MTTSPPRDFNQRAPFEKSSNTRPDTRLSPAARVRPLTPPPAASPSSTTSSFALSPWASVLGLAQGWL